MCVGDHRETPPAPSPLPAGVAQPVAPSATQASGERAYATCSAAAPAVTAASEGATVRRWPTDATAAALRPPNISTLSAILQTSSFTVLTESTAPVERHQNNVECHHRR